MRRRQRPVEVQGTMSDGDSCRAVHSCWVHSGRNTSGLVVRLHTGDHSKLWGYLRLHNRVPLQIRDYALPRLKLVAAAGSESNGQQVPDIREIHLLRRRSQLHRHRLHVARHAIARTAARQSGLKRLHHDAVRAGGMVLGTVDIRAEPVSRRAQARRDESLMQLRTTLQTLVSAALLAATTTMSAVAWRLPEWTAQCVLSFRARSYRAYYLNGSSQPEQTLPPYDHAARALDILQSYPRLSWSDPLAELVSAHLPIPRSMTLGHPFVLSAVVSLSLFGLAAAFGWIWCVRFLSPNYHENLRRHRRTYVVAGSTLLSATARLLPFSCAVAAGAGGLHAAVSVIVQPPFSEHDSEAWVLNGALFFCAIVMAWSLHRHYRREVAKHVPFAERHCPSCDYELLASHSPVCPECGAAQIHSLYEPVQHSRTTSRVIAACAFLAVVAAACLQSVTLHGWASGVRARREFPNVDFSLTSSRVIRVPADRSLIVDTDGVPPVWVIQVRSLTGTSTDTPRHEPTLLCLAAPAEVRDFLGQLKQPPSVEDLITTTDTVITGGVLSNGFSRGWIGTHPFTAVVDIGSAADSVHVTIRIESPLRIFRIKQCGAASDLETYCDVLQRVDLSRLPSPDKSLGSLGPPCRLGDVCDPAAVVR